MTDGKKQTLAQRQSAQAKRLERNLPANGGGPTTVSSGELKRAINLLNRGKK